jgi:hypothetical protein
MVRASFEVVPGFEFAVYIIVLSSMVLVIAR